MNRRSFIKGLIALASAPAIGKFVNVFKTEGARKGIENVASQGVDFFNSVIKKVMDEGTLVKEQDRISTYKHPDRPDITVDVDQTTGSSSVYFDTDEGGKAMGEITKTMDEGTGGAVVEDLMEAEEIYGPYGKDVQEGISGGITNLEKFLKGKKGFVAGGRVGFKYGGGSMISESDLKNLQGSDMESLDYFDLIGDELSGEELEGILRLLKALDYKKGGRVGMFRGGIPKGLQAALRAIMSKYGDDAITTTDTIPRPQQVIEAEETAQAIKDFNTRNPAYDPTDPFTTNKQAQDEFIRNEMDIAVRESEIENASPGFTGDMKYDAQVLADSFAEERFGKEFYDLPLKLQMSLYDEAYQALSQQFLKYRKFKNVTKPEKTLAAMKAGKGIDMSDPDIAAEFTRFMQESDPSGFKDVEEKVELMNFNPKGRKKNADGGSVDGDVSLTVIKIPDISESGVESLFKRR